MGDTMQPMSQEATHAPSSSRPGRFSIATLLLLIAATAIAMAALCRPSWLAANTIFSLLLLSLTISFIGMRHGKGRKRAFWAGYLAAGSLYAGMSMAPWIGEDVGPQLITTAFLDLAYPFMPPFPRPPIPRGHFPTPWEQWTSPPLDSNINHARNGMLMGTCHRSGDRSFDLRRTSRGWRKPWPDITTRVFGGHRPLPTTAVLDGLVGPEDGGGAHSGYEDCKAPLIVEGSRDCPVVIEGDIAEKGDKRISTFVG